MRGFLDRTEVRLEEVELDAVRWESPRARGEKILYVELMEDDLRAMGESLHATYRSLIADQPDYFKAETMEDVPRPVSPDVFTKNPKVLKRYLVQGSFWRNWTVRAVVARMNPWRTEQEHGASRYYIEEFRDVKLDKHHVILLLEVRVAGSEGSRFRTF